MAKDNLDELDQKKQQLKEELKQIQNELDQSIDQVRGDVASKLDPKSFIREHPLSVVGASALLGFLIGHKDHSADKGSSSDGLTRTLIYELKRLATKKAISYVTDFVEHKFDEKANEHLPSINGASEEQ